MKPFSYYSFCLLLVFGFLLGLHISPADAVFQMERGNHRVKFNTSGYSTTTNERNPEITVTNYKLDLVGWNVLVDYWVDVNNYNIPDLHIRSTRGGSRNSTYYQAYDVQSNYNSSSYIRRAKMRWASGDYMGDQCEHSGLWGMIYGYRRDRASWYGYHWWRPDNDPNWNDINWRGWSWYSFATSHKVRWIQLRSWTGEHAMDGWSPLVGLNQPPNNSAWHFNEWNIGMEISHIDLSYHEYRNDYYSVTNADYTSKAGVIEMGAKGLYWGKIWWSEGNTNGSSKRIRVYCRTSTSASSGYGGWIEVYSGAPLMYYLSKQSETHAGRTYYWQKRYMQIKVNMANPSSHYSTRPWLNNMYVDYFYDNTLPYPWRHYGYRVLHTKNGNEGLWAQRDGSSQLTCTTVNVNGHTPYMLELSRYNATVRLNNSSYDIPDLHIRTTRGSWHNDMYNAEGAFTNPGITRVRMRFGSSGGYAAASQAIMGVVYGYRRDVNSWHGYYTWHVPDPPQNNSIDWHGWNWYSLMSDSHRVSRVQLRSWVGEFENGPSGASNHPNHSAGPPAVLLWCYNEWAVPMEMSHIDVYYDGTYSRYYDNGWWESGKKSFDSGTEYYRWGMITWGERDRGWTIKCRGSDDGSTYGGWSGDRGQYGSLSDISNRYLQIRGETTSSGTTYPGPGTSGKLDWICAFYGVNRKPELQSMSISENIPSEWGNQDKRSQINYSNPAQASGFATWDPTSWVRITYKIYDPDGDNCRTVDWAMKCDALSIDWTDIPDSERSGNHAGYRAGYPAKTYNDLQWNTMPKTDGFYGDLVFRMRCKDELSLDGQTHLYTDYVEDTFFCDNNEPPAIASGSFQILPDPAYTTDTLYINTSMTATDTDGTVTLCHDAADLPTVEFRSAWTVGGVKAGDSAPELSSDNYVKGDTVTVEVFPFDAKEFGQRVTDSITISNKPPVITKIELTPSDPFTTDDLMCTVVATDDDEFIWRNDDLKGATIEPGDDPSGYVDGNIITTDVDGDNEWELQLR